VHTEHRLRQVRARAVDGWQQWLAASRGGLSRNDIWARALSLGVEEYGVKLERASFVSVPYAATPAQK